MTATSASQFVPAAPEAVWQAFIDPDQLVEWLPFPGMTGRMHRFDPCEGGGYELSLFYPEDEFHVFGKTGPKEDRFKVRFEALEAPRRIVETARFITNDEAFQGDITITVTLHAAPGGTDVTMAFDGIPKGMNPQDQAAGARLRLRQLAARFR